MIKSSEIKKAALNKLDWKQAFLASTLFVLANFALNYALQFADILTKNTPIFNLAANLIYLALSIPLSFGLVSVMSKLYKSQKVSATTLFNDAILNFTKSIDIFLGIFCKIILPSIVVIIAGLGILFITVQNLPATTDNLEGYSLYIIFISLVVLVCIALFAIPYALSSYILADNKDLSSKEILNQSASLMKNEKWNFVKLIMSFFGYFILLAVIVTIAGMAINKNVANIANAIGLIILMPYVITSIRVFYEEVQDDK